MVIFVHDECLPVNNTPRFAEERRRDKEKLCTFPLSHPPLVRRKESKV